MLFTHPKVNTAFLAWTTAGVLLATGCGPESAPDDQGIDDSLTAGVILPNYESLAPIFGDMEGDPIIASNNPESVNREGLLLATEQLNNTEPGRVKRFLTRTHLESGCPEGSLREFSFYMHHLNYLGSNARYYVFVEPAIPGRTVTFNAYGAAISQVDTGSLEPGEGPSYAVSLALVLGHLPEGVRTSAGSKFINERGRAIQSRYPLVNLGAVQNSSLDARFKVRSLNQECMKVRVVAASEANATAQRAYELSQRAFAWGNTWAPCMDEDNIAWGRPAGVYRYDSWKGSTSVPIGRANSIQGWRLLAAPTNRQTGNNCVPRDGGIAPNGFNQRAPAISYYNSNTSGVTEGRDSDPYSTANYGVEYKMQVKASNTSGTCVDARLVLTSYPGTKKCTEAGDGRTRHWDGAFRVTANGGPAQINRVFVNCAVRPESTIASTRLQAGQSVTWDFQTFVPGLISAPEGLLVKSCPCGQACN